MPDNLKHTRDHSFSVRKWTIVSLAGWTLVCTIFAFYSFMLIEESTLAQVHTKAREAFNKDQSFRYWATEHGGVYVPQTQKTPSNPYLTNVEERDITTPKGRALTLMNPAYMVRQLNESFNSLYGMQGHITSLKPLRPENGPDDWEEKALLAFENGTEEVYEIVKEKGHEYARLMRPMPVMQGCLKCHEHQGYKLGDVRGGVSVRVPLVPFMPARNSLILQSGILFTLLWLAGGGLAIFGASLLANNLREREAMTKSLHKAKAVAEAANSAKTVFLANMSHEIRTPLNGIVGMLQLFHATPLSSEQTEYADAAMESSERLTDLLSDILDLSMAETGVMELRREPLELATVFALTQKLFNATIRQSGLDLTFFINPDIPMDLQGDAVRLEQVLTNLIGNSIKFTDKGSIQVEAHNLPSASPETCRILFSVADTGRGIADDKLTRLFEPFTQEDEGYNKSYQGAGLGLSICKRLVELMGGDMVVTSEVGEGTVVYFSAMFNVVPTHHAEISSHEAGNGLPFLDLKVLLAEDDRVSRLAAQRIMERIGCRVTSVENGAQALDALRKEHFDLVVMDIQMPEIDGMEATRAIRAGDAGSANTDIPVIALTAYAMASDRNNFTQAGMNGYIAKPIDIQAMLAELSQYTPA